MSKQKDNLQYKNKKGKKILQYFVSGKKVLQHQKNICMLVN